MKFLGNGAKYRDFFLISGGRFFQILLSLVSVRVITTVLSTSEVGNFYLINSFFGFFGLALINPVGMFIHRRTNKWAAEGTFLDCLFLFNCYLVLVSLFSALLVFLFAHTIGMNGEKNLTDLILYIMLSVYLTTWNQTLIPALNMLNHRMAFVVLNLLTLSLGLVLSLTAIKVFSATALAWLNGQLVAQGAVVFLAFLFFKKVVGGRFDRSQAQKMVNQDNLRSVALFSFPLGITTLFIWMQYQSYRPVIERSIGLEFLGLIGLGMSLSSNIATAFESIVQQLYYPAYYREINAVEPGKRAEAWNRMAEVTLPVYLSLAIFVSFLAPFIVNLLASRKFGEAFIFIIYGAWIEFFRMVTNILASVAHAEMQTKGLIKSYGVGGVLAVAGTFLGCHSAAPRQVIPLMLVASGLITMTIMFLDMKKLTHIRLPIRKLLTAGVASLPFCLALGFSELPTNIYMSGGLMLIFGCYFLYIHRDCVHLLTGKSQRSTADVLQG